VEFIFARRIGSREEDSMANALISWLTSLVAGGAGGNIIGALMKDRSLGPMLNSVLGAVGGAVGGQLLPMLIPALQGGGIGKNVGLSAIVGIVLPLIVSMLKKKA
jgi:uncharacterized membrane protein YeaQ/YmgE (transglycosylase-associated protein family)